MNIKSISEFYFDSRIVGHVLIKLYIDESCKESPVISNCF